MKKESRNESGINFKNNYLPNVDIAIARAKEFESDEYGLIDNIGCNIWKLIEAMKNYGIK